MLNMEGCVCIQAGHVEHVPVVRVGDAELATRQATHYQSEQKKLREICLIFEPIKGLMKPIKEHFQMM